MNLSGHLVAEAKAAGFSLEPSVADACAHHHALLVRWNRTHNLTRVTEEAEAAHRHYLDCLWPALVTPIEQRRDAIDIGSGAGFPGLVLALAWPDCKVALIEPAQKRASFLRLAVAELGLGSRVHVARTPVAPGPLVLSRATFSRGGRGPLAAALQLGGTLWLWSVPAEETSWPAEARALGLEPLQSLTAIIRGQRRVILRATRISPL